MAELEFLRRKFRHYELEKEMADLRVGLEKLKDLKVNIEPYQMKFDSFERFERARAMITYCTEYESESFELFYKWFKQNKGKED